MTGLARKGKELIFEEMRILAVETGTNLQSIALLYEEQVLAYANQESMGSHTKHLVPGIHSLLSSKGVMPSDLDGLAVGIGPGSFSGLRVGLAVMAGFRLTLNIPLVAVPTLEAMAWGLRFTNATICPILKAREGIVYWACFRWVGDKLLTVVPEQVGSLDSLVESLVGPTLVFGEGWALNKEAFLRMTDFMDEAPVEAIGPTAVNVGLASLSQFKRGRFATAGISPHYIQRSYAELKQ